ncbi:MAG: hypothetical protein J6Z43_04135 [Clostridiales bacterium]|nr:hypothetical protein [Clostridiales bacterium]
MTIIKKTLSVFITLSLVLTMGIAAFATGGGTVEDLDASTLVRDTLSVSGTTEDVTAAVFVQVLSGEEIVASQTLTVDTDGSFSGIIKVNGCNLEDGNYQVRAADLDGGLWITTTIDSSSPLVARYNIRLDGSVGVNYWIDEDAVDMDDDTTVTFTYDSQLNDLKTQTVTGTLKDDGDKSFRIFSCKVAPAELTKAISATLNLGDETIQLDDMSARTIIRAYTNDDPNDKLSNLAKNLLNYGYYSQAKFLPDDAMFDEDKITLQDSTATPHTFTTPDGIEFRGASVVFNSGNKIKLYFNKEASTAEFTVNDVPCSAVVTGNLCYIYTAEIPVLRLNEPATISINGEETSYSVLNYVYAVLNSQSTSDEMKDLVKALEMYYNAAVAYNNSISGE